MAAHPVLISDQWKASQGNDTFRAEDPKAAAAIAEDYPISPWSECSEALDAAVVAFEQLKKCSVDQIADFLNKFAERIETRSAEICDLASKETALPVEPRLASGELPRTTGQLRQAAAAAKNHAWCQPTIDTVSNIRSCYSAIGPVLVFGPNNFPLAFGSVSGGDFAAAIAAGNPVIAKAHVLHPGTTRLLAEEALAASQEAGLPAGTVQMIYHMSHEDGFRMAGDPRLAAIGFTGSRNAGLKLKEAADAVGKPIFLELSSINPVVVLKSVLQQRGEELATELAGSCLMGTGQFCTSPGLVVMPKGKEADKFTDALVAKFKEAPVGTLLSKSGQQGLQSAIETLQGHGAEILCGGTIGGGQGYSVANTVMTVSGSEFLANAIGLQHEAFGNATLVVKADSTDQVVSIVKSMEGNLTGCIYSAEDGSDDGDYEAIVPHLRQKVGRLLNDKMPTGVAVCSAMNHGGPFPSTSNAAFTAVGMPGALLRFSMLQCYDNVRPQRLPEVLQDGNPTGAWRLIDGQWSKS